MFKIKRKKKGLTLIETLISFLILTFVLTPILMVVNSSVKLNKTGDDNQKSLYIAQKYVEDFKQAQDVKTDFIDKGEEQPKETGDSEDTTNIKFYETVTEGDLNIDYVIKAKIIPQPFENQQNITTLYDAKVKIDKNNTLNIYSNVNTILKDYSITNNTCTINITNDSGNVIIKVDNLADQPIPKRSRASDEVDKDSGEVIIQLDRYEKGKVISFNVKNTLPNPFNIYLQKDSQLTNTDYSIQNQLGSIKVYNSMIADENQNVLSTMVYKINVKVWRKSQNIETDQPIQQISSYRALNQ